MELQIEKKREFPIDLGVYNKSLLSRKIYIPFKKVNKNIKELLEKNIKKEIEGKCTIEGFVKPNSTIVLRYSSGLLVEDLITFDVVFECLICCPVEGMNIKCIGIRAIIDGDISPVVIYVTKDHHYDNNYYNSLNEEDEIKVTVIGQRYELNDNQVSVIGKIVEPSNNDKYKKNIPK
jgi:DNA-directed RNA polymerase subunit E'/Rpb7